MRLVLDCKESFGELIFVGHKERFKYDAVTKTKTDEVAGFNLHLASGALGLPIEVAVPIEVPVTDIKFGARVMLEGATIDPYGKTTKDSSFAEVALRISATAVLDASGQTPIGTKQGELKQGEPKQGEPKK